MIRNVDIQLKSVRNQVLIKEITEDIVKIQVLSNEKVFRKAIKLFIEKWSGFAEIINFIDYLLLSIIFKKMLIQSIIGRYTKNQMKK